MPNWKKVAKRSLWSFVIFAAIGFAAGFRPAKRREEELPIR